MKRLPDWYYTTKALLDKDKEQRKQALDEISSHIFDVYRAVLGDDFTVNGLLGASMDGVEIPHWDKLSTDIQNWAWALGARIPEKVDFKNLSPAAVDACTKYFAEKEQPLSPQQVELFPELMRGLLTTLQQTGVQFGNNYPQAFLPGMVHLVHHYKWVVGAGQHFMDLDKDYPVELTITENAIKAAQRPLIAAIEASGELAVKRGYSGRTISGIVKAEITGDSTFGLEPFGIGYETEDGKSGVIEDVLNAYLFSRREDREGFRAQRLTLGEDIGNEGRSDILLPEEYHQALVGLPPSNLAQELRVGVWRKWFGRAGADFSQPPQVTLINSYSQEKVEFYYALTRPQETEPKAFVVLTFDERYGGSFVNACTPEFMQKELGSATQREHVFKEFSPKDGYTAQPSEKMSVQEYLKRRTSGFMFTKHVA